jgi:hypothetical protein
VLPVVYNMVPHGAIEDITARLNEIICAYTAVNARPFDHLQQTDKDGETVTTGVVNDSLVDVHTHLPFKDNIADRAPCGCCLTPICTQMRYYGSVSLARYLDC